MWRFQRSAGSIAEGSELLLKHTTVGTKNCVAGAAGGTSTDLTPDGAVSGTPHTAPSEPGAAETSPVDLGREEEKKDSLFASQCHEVWWRRDNGMRGESDLRDSRLVNEPTVWQKSNGMKVLDKTARGDRAHCCELPHHSFLRFSRLCKVLRLKLIQHN